MKVQEVIQKNNSKIIAMLSLRLPMISFLVFLLSGCGTGHYRLHTGQNILPTQIAILKGKLPLVLNEIDGQPGPNFAGLGFRKRYNSKWDGRFVIELLPGTHILQVGYDDTKNLTRPHSLHEQTVTLKAKPGSAYVVEGVRYGENLWRPSLRQVKYEESAAN